MICGSTIPQARNGPGSLAAIRSAKPAYRAHWERLHPETRQELEKGPSDGSTRAGTSCFLAVTAWTPVIMRVGSTICGSSIHRLRNGHGSEEPALCPLEAAVRKRHPEFTESWVRTPPETFLRAEHRPWDGQTVRATCDFLEAMHTTKLVETFTSTISGNSIALSMNGDGRAAVSSPLAMPLGGLTGH
jgi:hypothetical protein